MTRQSLITDSMRRAIGTESVALTTEIEKGAIHEFAEAIGDPNPLYRDEVAARHSRYGGIIAPLDFNPFAWPVDREPPPAGRATAQGAGVGTRGMNGGQTEEYFSPMRPGDVISSTAGLVDWNERQTRLGLTLFTINETRWTNQNGELVKVKRSTGIRY